MTSDDILVILEQREGDIAIDSLLLIGEAWRLTGMYHGASGISVVVFGLDLQKLSISLGPYKVNKVFYNEAMPKDYDSDSYIPALSSLVKDHQPSLILMLSSPVGDDIGARLAAELQAPLICKCVDFKTGSSGQPIFIKSVNRNMVYAQWRAENQRYTIATVIPEILEPFSPVPTFPPETVKVSWARPEVKRIIRCEFKKGDHRTIDLDEAEVVVAAGRGALNGRGYHLTVRFADLLGATLACTRPLVDLNILPFERQIGQTGKSISPKLLITCGVSGAFEFKVGIGRSTKIIAIDIDSKARIFQYADLGIVGCLEEVLSEMIDRLQK